MRIDSSSRSPLACLDAAVGDELVAGLEPDEVADDDLLDRDARRRRRRGRPWPCGATSAASRSSARFARTSWAIPIAEFATRMPRKSASRQSPKASVSAPNDGEDQVEDREDVGPDDARVGAARPCARDGGHASQRAERVRDHGHVDRLLQQRTADRGDQACRSEHHRREREPDARRRRSAARSRASGGRSRSRRRPDRAGRRARSRPRPRTTRSTPPRPSRSRRPRARAPARR